MNSTIRKVVDDAVHDDWITFHELRNRACADAPGVSDTSLRRALTDLIAAGIVETRTERPPQKACYLVFRRRAS